MGSKMSQNFEMLNLEKIEKSMNFDGERKSTSVRPQKGKYL